MFASAAKYRSFLAIGGMLTALLAALIALQLGQPLALSRSGKPIGAEDALSTMRARLAEDRSLLADYEQEQAKLRAEVIKRRRLFQDGQIAKDEVQEAERAFVAALRRVHETRYSVVETDIAITETILGEKVERMPALPVNGYGETKDLARFNGARKWSLRDAPSIEKYFSQKFGRRMPITALGQSATHHRLRFDHRDAMDVALHPDSVEGQALIAHLRKSGIPFIAFRGAAAGASTGPHIHIGRPSRRLAS